MPVPLALLAAGALSAAGSVGAAALQDSGGSSGGPTAAQAATQRILIRGLLDRIASGVGSMSIPELRRQSRTREGIPGFELPLIGVPEAEALGFFPPGNPLSPVPDPGGQPVIPSFLTQPQLEAQTQLGTPRGLMEGLRLDLIEQAGLPLEVILAALPFINSTGAVPPTGSRPQMPQQIPQQPGPQAQQFGSSASFPALMTQIFSQSNNPMGPKGGR